MATGDRNLASQIHWRSDVGEILYFHFRKALGHIPHEKLLKSFRCPGIRQDGIPEPANRDRGSKFGAGRSNVSHGICSLQSPVTGKLMGILR